ncbi:hypothetical protein A0130_02590 [Leifsonia xyli]|uniref:hypothetical protein n=1 Tax=Leifsonia xyli TaxID=1575 RepID=UPI0007CDCDEC|nr:hypothetical protein A0130_02590 [Leifsonia xyli]
MARLNRETAMQALNRPWSWDEFTIHFTWQKDTFGGVPFRAVVAVVSQSGEADVHVMVTCADTAPDLIPDVYAYGPDTAGCDRADVFIDDHEGDGLIDFIEATGRLISRVTVPEDETFPRQLAGAPARLW